ncbi:MAG: aminotransferase class IV [Spirochaetota bacterium]|nr:aminotransferase class IV [Spirochaetota bacterium]
MSDNYVILNDKLIKQTIARISINDSGFLYGFGCYDTLLALNYKLLFVEEHIKRLNDSLRELRISRMGFDPIELTEKVSNLLIINKHRNARIRITVTKEDIDLTNIHIENPKMNQLITSSKLAEDYYNRDVKPFKLCISKYIRNHPESIPPSLKLTSLANHLFASMDAKEKGFDDGIMLTHEGYLTEGTSFNIFFVKNNKLFTPHLKTGILPGITRSVLLNLFKEKNIIFEEGFYKRESLYEADEAFVTSSVRGIVPIIQVDQCVKTTGDSTKMIVEYYYQYLKELSCNE